MRGQKTNKLHTNKPGYVCVLGDGAGGGGGWMCVCVWSGGRGCMDVGVAEKEG